MKLKKKIIILSVLFLFGFGVFFGTFASGGYFVKADTDVNINYGTYTINGTTIESEDPYTLNIEVYYNAGDEYYTIMLQYINRVYEIETEDLYYFFSGREEYSTQNNLILTNYRDIESTDFDVLEILSYYDSESEYYIAEFYFSYENIYNDPAYYYINLYLSDIYLDVQGGDIETDIDINFISRNMYNKIYTIGKNAGDTIGFNRGYSVGYQAGAEAGYTDGYDLGYSDGLDVGYYNGYETGHYEGYTEGEASGYSAGLDAGYWVGLDEGLNISGYKEAYDKGVKYTENTASTWFKGIFKGIQGFLDIRIMNVSIGAILLVPFAITFVWFIIRQFRGGGGGD